MQTSTDELALALLDRGCGVTVLCGRMDGRESGPSLRHDHSLGYPVVRAADPVAALAQVAADAGASVLLVQSGYSLAAMLASALDTGRPAAVYLHNVEIHRIGGTLPPDPAILYFANSRFTASRWKALFGIRCHILPPVIRADRYRVPGTGDRVLFVNPVPEKGIERVMEVAAGNPDLPFLIAESWHVGEGWRAWLQRRFGALPNVEWRPATVDVRELFRDSRLLLMPSVWEEAYGRTVVEAQLNGLPVLASDRGALPATVGGEAPSWTRKVRGRCGTRRCGDSISTSPFGERLRRRQSPTLGGCWPMAPARWTKLWAFSTGTGADMSRRAVRHPGDAASVAYPVTHQFTS
ncbi:glycosyltransferase [Azospirillum thermophilum]|uniref:glycosyltransferase n=1 Tax=Azospirillum thermophilum TaxID=2202148 RepID=UPI001FE41331|nr:glycosyltransferase [Azospirillum thermophilum]